MATRVQRLAFLTTTVVAVAFARSLGPGQVPDGLYEAPPTGSTTPVSHRQTATLLAAARPIGNDHFDKIQVHGGPQMSAANMRPITKPPSCLALVSIRCTGTGTGTTD